MRVREKNMLIDWLNSSEITVILSLTDNNVSIKLAASDNAKSELICGE
ncbi:MAG: hypothetical protein LBL77_03230 [Endomicrobium sp.]|jgi:hypothetical protein|nr:hypothetical protein [Endomicrobium sp.]